MHGHTSQSGPCSFLSETSLHLPIKICKICLSTRLPISPFPALLLLKALVTISMLCVSYLSSVSCSGWSSPGRCFCLSSLLCPQQHLCTVGLDVKILHKQSSIHRGRNEAWGLLPGWWQHHTCTKQVAPKFSLFILPPPQPVGQSRQAESVPVAAPDPFSRPHVLTSASRNSPFKIAMSLRAFRGLCLPTDVMPY
uniref:Uncharacterized protein n=1 Tax=Molossus molossus TaxID=27622 RepID=A0A7J8I963_MOLMO|nr:hypothetical protein HJG59_010646 [Molossus molossus]